MEQGRDEEISCRYNRVARKRRHISWSSSPNKRLSRHRLNSLVHFETMTTDPDFIKNLLDITSTSLTPSPTCFRTPMATTGDCAPVLHSRSIGVAKQKLPDSDDPQICGGVVEQKPLDYDNPQICEDIRVYLHSMEVEDKRRPIPDYMETLQRDVTADMRRMLVDWLVEIAWHYRLLSDTIFLAVSYMDRYLSSKPISRGIFQLLGVSCMFIALKYNETNLHVNVEEFSNITNNAYIKEEVLNMEFNILKALNFEVGNPTTMTFLRIFTRTTQSDLQSELLASYLAELCLLEYDCIRFLPSLVAASVIFLANFTIHPETQPWSLSLQKVTGYKQCDLKECVLDIHDLQLTRKGGDLIIVVREKYKLKKYKSVASISSLPDIPPTYFDEVEC